MRKKSSTTVRRRAWLWSFGAALAPLAGLLIPSHMEDAVANGDTRTLTVYHVHTRETTTATFRVNGNYDRAALEKLNWALRDWRRDEPTKIDPRLFDVAWEVHREVDASQPIQILSAFRSPETNAMLRRRSRAVAEYSQHMLGKAMDVHLTDVPMSRVREVAMRLQRGGVGYYPTSGTPFVHMDVGNVRYWPRMSRQDLARIFPDGKTVDIPSDGQPMPRYQEALAEIQARGGQAYYATAEAGASKGKGLLAMLFGGDEEDGGRASAPTAAPAVAEQPRSNPIATIANLIPSDDNAAAQPAATTAVAVADRGPDRTADVPVPVAKPRVLAENGIVLAADASRIDPNAPPVPVPPPRPTGLGKPVFADVPVPPSRPAELAFKPAGKPSLEPPAHGDLAQSAPAKADNAKADTAKTDTAKTDTAKADVAKAAAAKANAELAKSRATKTATVANESEARGAAFGQSARSAPVPKSDGKLNVVAIPPSSRLAGRVPLPNVITEGAAQTTPQPSALSFAETPATRGLQRSALAGTQAGVGGRAATSAQRKTQFVAARIDRSNFRTLTALAPTERSTTYTAQGVGSAVAPMRAAAQTQRTAVIPQGQDVVATFGDRAPYGDLKPGAFSGPAVKAFSMVDGFETIGRTN